MNDVQLAESGYSDINMFEDCIKDELYSYGFMKNGISVLASTTSLIQNGQPILSFSEALEVESQDGKTKISCILKYFKCQVKDLISKQSAEIPISPRLIEKIYDQYRVRGSNTPKFIPRYPQHATYEVHW